ncbi:MAG: TorF family putative porin [Planctomycetota bacterium]
MAMRRGLWPVGVVTVVLATLAGGARGEEPRPEQPPAEVPAGASKDWSVELDLTYNSHYVWRGLNFTDDPVFQPSVTFAWKGLSVNAWGNMDLTDVNGNNDEFNEVDLTVDYSGGVGKLAYSVGLIRYHFPNTPFPGTTEVYGSLGLDVPLSPTLTVYYDCDEADGAYATVGVGHTFADLVTLSEACSVSCEIGATVACADEDYNAFYFGVADAALVDAVLSVSFPVTVHEHITVTPAAHYSNILDDKLAAAAGKESNFWTGVSVTVGF